jgi:hypothetical protein
MKRGGTAGLGRLQCGECRTDGWSSTPRWGTLPDVAVLPPDLVRLANVRSFVRGVPDLFNGTTSDALAHEG